MTARVGAGLILFIAGFTPVSVSADEVLNFNGLFMQGGLVIAKTQPGSRVQYKKQNIRVSKDGIFVLGFGRDEAKSGDVLITKPGGEISRQSFTVRPQTYKTTRIDGLPKRKVTPKAVDQKRINADNAKIGAVRKLDSAMTDFQSGFTWPVKGRVSGVFGSQRILNGKPRRPHNGMDIAAPKGTPVLASADGVVALVHENMFYSGKTVMIDHGHGLTSVYIHMNSISVKAGRRIGQGEQIGTIGMTGRATGPHLHWGINLFKMPLDPKLLVIGEKAISRTD